MKQLEHDPSPWWRHRMMWLVVGGPLVVVVAATVTGVIAVRGADPVLRVVEEPPSASSAPAQEARNHAATPPQTKP
jgi:hypothetical protein